MKKLLILAVFSVMIVSVSFASISAQTQYDIPSWIKGVAGYWVEGNITNDDFGEAISFLIDQEILKIPLIEQLKNENTQLKAENSELYTQLNLPEPEPTSELEVLISIQTVDNQYDEGDMVIILGNVSTIIDNTPVTLQLFTEENVVDIVQITVAGDGSFSHKIIAEGPLWKNIGDYLIRVSYGEGNFAETEFSFTPKPYIPETTAIFEVDAGSDGTFDVEYTIKGGTIEYMIVDSSIFALIVQIASTDEGTVSLDLSRDLIGAEKQDGTDNTFTILIDGIEVAYQESVLNSDSRVIKINFEKGDSEIKILGTVILGDKSDTVITVKVDRQVYQNGNLVRITGELVNIDDLDKVLVIVYNHQGDFVDEPKIFASPNSFFSSIIAGGSMYSEFGQYSVKVFYNDRLKAETNFWYNTD